MDIANFLVLVIHPGPASRRVEHGIINMVRFFPVRYQDGSKVVPLALELGDQSCPSSRLSRHFVFAFCVFFLWRPLRLVVFRLCLMWQAPLGRAVDGRLGRQLRVPPAVRRLFSGVGRRSVGVRVVVASDGDSVVVPCVAPSHLSNESSSEIILSCQGLAGGCVRHEVEISVGVGRSHFGSSGRPTVLSGMDVSVGLWHGRTVSCLNLARSSTLPGPSSPLPTKVVGSVWSSVVVAALHIPDLIVFVVVPSGSGGWMCAGESVMDGVSNVGRHGNVTKERDEHDAVGVVACDGVSGLVVLGVGSDSGREVVSHVSDGWPSGEQCVGREPWIDVGAIGSCVLCCVGGSCFGSSCREVGGAHVIGRSSGYVVPMPRSDACATRPVPTKDEDASSQSVSASGLTAFPVSAFPVILGYDGGNMCRIVLHDGRYSPSNASSPSFAVEVSDVGLGESSSSGVGALPCSVDVVSVPAPFGDPIGSWYAHNEGWFVFCYEREPVEIAHGVLHIRGDKFRFLINGREEYEDIFRIFRGKVVRWADVVRGRFVGRVAWS